MTVKEFWKNGGYDFKNEKIRIPAKYLWNIQVDKVYSSYMETVKSRDEFLSPDEFEEKLAVVISDEIETKEYEDQQALEGSYQIDTVKDEIELIKRVMDREGIKHDRQGNNITCHGISLSMSQLEDKVVCYSDKYTKDSKRIAIESRREVFSTDEMKRSLRNHFTDLHIVSRKDLNKDLLIYSAKAEDYVNDVLRYVVEQWEIEGDVDFNVNMFKQLFWQIKRYAIGLRVGSPYFFNINGKQNTGKTTLLKKLMQNLSDFLAEAVFSDILDDRKSKLWSQNLVVVFDEIQIGNVDGKQMGALISAIKSLLTSTEIQFRELNTHSNVKMDRVFTAIASSNHSIVNVIRDETGMRRFYEFNMNEDIDISNEAGRERLDFFFEDFDVKHFWDGIDPNLEKGYVHSSNKFGVELERIQGEYKHEDYMDMVLADEDFIDHGVLSVEDVDNDIIELLREIANGDKSDYGTGYEMLTTMDFAKNITDRIKEFGNNLSQFAPTPMTIVNRMKGKGLLVVKNCKGKTFAFKKEV